MNVTRVSLEDFFWTMKIFYDREGLPLWDKNSTKAMSVRNRYKSDRSERTDESDPYSIKDATPEVAANTLICLINQASFLFNGQIQKQEESFLNEGGFTERMYKARIKRRN